MQFSTRAIVISKTNYGDNDAVVKFYSSNFGVLNIFVKGLRSKKNKKLALLSPLNLVDIVGTRKENDKLAWLKEISLSHAYQSLGIDFTKTSIAFFLGEFLSRILQEEHPDQAFYNYLETALKVLDSIENPANFHLLFLCKMSFFLGVEPHLDTFNKGDCFNLSEGCFETKNMFAAHHYADTEISEKLHQLFQLPFEKIESFGLNRIQRKMLLNLLIDYYTVRFGSLSKLNSVSVLSEIM
jgi:DNA repair protein RecO (recombination protein O)